MRKSYSIHRSTVHSFYQQRLDTALLATYGWPHTLSDEEILERLLALNLARSGA